VAAACFQPQRRAASRTMAPPKGIVAAEEMDKASQYGVKAPIKLPMFGSATQVEPSFNSYNSGNGKVGAIRSARQEAKRLSTRLTTKWFAAVEDGEMMRVKQLFADGQDINEMHPQQGSTALYIAARKNNLRMAELLLQSGAEPSILTDDHVSPAWIAVSRGFDEMLELLLNPKWSGALVKLISTESTESISQIPNCGIQQTHLQLANMRRYWRCLYLLEQACGVSPSKIPDTFVIPPDGWAMGLAPAEPGQRTDMPMHFFYWKAFTKEACQNEAPEGSKFLKHIGGGRFE